MDSEEDPNSPSRNPDQDPLSRLPSKSTVPDAEITSNNAQESGYEKSTTKQLVREFRWFEVLSLVISSVLALVGIGALVVYYRQLTVMHEQLSVMKAQVEATIAQFNFSRRALEVEQRPWITVTATMGGPFELDEFGARTTIHLRINNLGRSPAISVHTETMLVAQDVATNVYSLCHDRGYELRAILFPGDHAEVDEAIVMKPSEVERAIRTHGTFDGNSTVVVGCVSYHWVFDSTEQTIPFAYAVVLPNEPKFSNNGRTGRIPPKAIWLHEIRKFPHE